MTCTLSLGICYILPIRPLIRPLPTSTLLFANRVHRIPRRLRSGCVRYQCPGTSWAAWAACCALCLLGPRCCGWAIPSIPSLSPALTPPDLHFSASPTAHSRSGISHETPHLKETPSPSLSCSFHHTTLPPPKRIQASKHPSQLCTRVHSFHSLLRHTPRSTQIAAQNVQLQAGAPQAPRVRLPPLPSFSPSRPHASSSFLSR